MGDVGVAVVTPLLAMGLHRQHIGGVDQRGIGFGIVGVHLLGQFELPDDAGAVSARGRPLPGIALGAVGRENGGRGRRNLCRPRWLGSGAAPFHAVLPTRAAVEFCPDRGFNILG